jgi:predicted HNH restriction endonuclease
LSPEARNAWLSNDRSRISPRSWKNTARFILWLTGKSASTKRDNEQHAQNSDLHGNDSNKHKTVKRKPIFDSIIDEYVLEGERLLIQKETTKRDARIVAKAKRQFGSICQVCSFDFGEVYGEIGRGFVDAHHIDPLHLRAGKSRRTSVNDFAHRTVSALTIEQLKAIVAGNKIRPT